MPTKKSSSSGNLPVPVTLIERRIYLIREQKVMVDTDQVNIVIMRAFVKLRQMLESNEELNRKFALVIRRLATHNEYFAVVFDELKKLTTQPTESGRRIGFTTKEEKKPTKVRKTHRSLNVSSAEPETAK